jgi:carbon monoxide dehydrogenase subunit G
MRFQEEALLRAAPEQVWEVLADWERQASWMPDVAWIRVVGPEREIGATLEVRTKVFGIPLATDRARVTAWEPPRRLAVEHVGVVIGVGEWRLEPHEGGTRFTWFEEFRMPPPLLGDLALLLYSPFQRFMLRRSIRNLRRLVESPGDRPSPARPS